MCVSFLCSGLRLLSQWFIESASPCIEIILQSTNKFILHPNIKKEIETIQRINSYGFISQ